jgi:hypothetical protein
VEILQVAFSIVKAFGGAGKTEIRVNNRRLVDHLFQRVLGFSGEVALKISKAVDARAKIGEEKAHCISFSLCGSLAAVVIRPARCYRMRVSVSPSPPPLLLTMSNLTVVRVISTTCTIAPGSGPSGVRCVRAKRSPALRVKDWGLRPAPSRRPPLPFAPGMLCIPSFGLLLEEAAHLGGVGVPDIAAERIILRGAGNDVRVTLRPSGQVHGGVVTVLNGLGCHGLFPFGVLFVSLIRLCTFSYQMSSGFDMILWLSNNL